MIRLQTSKRGMWAGAALLAPKEVSLEWAEMKAADFAVSQACIQEEQPIILEGDSQSLINAIKGQISGRGAFCHVLEDIFR